MAQRGPAAYYGSIPQIAQARQNNPLQQLAAQNLANAASTAPVAQGKYAWMDGLARALQAVPGMVQNKRLDKQYGEREQEYMKQMGEAAGLASTPQPAAANPATMNPATDAVQQAAAALGGPGGGAAAMVGGAQPPAMPPQPPQMAQNGQSQASPYSPSRQQMNAAQPPFSPAPEASPGGQGSTQGSGIDLEAMFEQGIIGGGERSRARADGTYETSFKGAVGRAQVMPATAREVARSLGIRFDEDRYRNDTQYNMMLGREYFRQQMETFQDPLKAAAAYNAGPGAVRRAVRRAGRSGGSWMDYLPSTTKDGKVVDTTRKYVERFAQSIGSPTRSRGSSNEVSTYRANILDPIIPQAQDEPVPEGVRMPSQAEAPGPYQVPDEVQSNRIAIAQQMLASGNPDMAVIAQQYLDSGLTEQNNARTQRSDQLQQRNRDLYSTQEMDYRSARSDGRQQQMTDRTNAQSRNFQRQEATRDMRFRADEATRDMEFRRGEAQTQRTWEEEQYATRFENERELAEIRTQAQAKDMFWNSATGERIQQEYRESRDSRNELRDKILSFLSLNETTTTGGLRRYTSGIESAWNDNLETMKGLANQITIEELGGLGIAISDGDRDFVSESMLSVGSPYEANRDRAEILLALIDRAGQRDREFLRWRAENPPQTMYQFEELWDAYKNTNELLYRDGEQVLMRDNVPSFQEWLSNIPIEGE